MRRQLLVIVLAVLALRVPFLNQAIQGDDVYYLYGAEHAQIDPLHPNHAQYPFLGRIVDMRGHPHPPLNSWVLAALLALFETVNEPAFHTVYISFSLIAALSAFSIARRFTARPLAATLLFLVTPAFVVNGNSLESDLPFLAFWLLSLALFLAACDRRSLPLLLASCLPMALSALAAYQAIVLVPILLLYGRKWRSAWAAALLTIPLTLAAFQLFERFTSGALPATVLAGYLDTYGLEQFTQKIRNAVALTGHLAWVNFPLLWLPGLLAVPVAIAAAFYDPNPLFWASLAVGVGILVTLIRRWREFLPQWILIFFAAALILFFAGSARYLLPIALPLSILATQRRGPGWLYPAIACEAALSLLLATVNYQHWDGYRRFARSLESEAGNSRVWVNGEWGLRFYLESEGALPLLEGQAVHPGESVVTSQLAYPVAFTTGGGLPVVTREQTLNSPIPLRLFALNSRSGYSTTAFGLRPFDVSLSPFDRVRAETVLERQPTVSALPMNASEAAQQIVSGVFSLESGQWRWMSGRADLVLKPPAARAALTLDFAIPDASPARTVAVSINGAEAARQTYPGPGRYTLTTPPVSVPGVSAAISITVDKTFSPPGDQRALGIILTRAALDPR